MHENRALGVVIQRHLNRASATFNGASDGLHDRRRSQLAVAKRRSRHHVVACSAVAASGPK